jgi:hypothetical protein
MNILDDKTLADLCGINKDSLKEIERDFTPVRARIQACLDKQPKFVTLKQAQKQINKFNE